jgi:hypothetical protein
MADCITYTPIKHKRKRETKPYFPEPYFPEPYFERQCLSWCLIHAINMYMQKPLFATFKKMIEIVNGMRTANGKMYDNSNYEMYHPETGNFVPIAAVYFLEQLAGICLVQRTLATPSDLREIMRKVSRVMLINPGVHITTVLSQGAQLILLDSEKDGPIFMTDQSVDLLIKNGYKTVYMEGVRNRPVYHEEVL